MHTLKKFNICDVFSLCFEAISGLKINLANSEIVPIGEVRDVEELANILGCRVSSLPMKYLGLGLAIQVGGSSLCQPLSGWSTTRLTTRIIIGLERVNPIVFKKNKILKINKNAINGLGKKN
jgi:hypothetical protein